MTATTTRRFRMRHAAAALAAAALAGTILLPATTANAAETEGAAGWQDGLVLPGVRTAALDGGLNGFFCTDMKNGIGSAFSVEIAKTDQNGDPIEGVEFEIEFEAGGYGYPRAALDDWEQHRDRGLEQTRLDAATEARDAMLALSEYRNGPWSEAYDALAEAKDAVTAAEKQAEPAQEVLDLAIATDEAEAELLADPSRWEGLTEAEVREQLAERREERGIPTTAEAEEAFAPFREAIEDAEAAVAERESEFETADAELDALSDTWQAALDTEAAAAEAIATHLIEAGMPLNEWTRTTDEQGEIALETVGCSNGTFTITETAVPEGISQDGIGQTFTFDTATGEIVAADGIYTAGAYDLDYDVAAGESSPGVMHLAVGSQAVAVVNERLPEEPETPETPPTTPPETPETPEPPVTETIPPSNPEPVRPPVVSG